MQVNETAVLRSRMYLHCHKTWSQHGFQTLKPSCLLQWLKIIIVVVVLVVFFIFIIIIINIVVIILILAVGQWHFQLPFCIIYSHTCVNCALPLNFLFSSSVCDPDFRGLSPPSKAQLHYSAEITGFVPVSAYYILTQHCLLGFYFMFALPLIINHTIIPCPKLLPEELPFVISLPRANVGFFPTTLLFSTNSCISNLVWFQSAQIW